MKAERDNEALRKSVKDFEKLRKKQREFWEPGFNKDAQFHILRGLCEMVLSIVGINEYKGAELAYLYTIPMIENFLIYLRAGISRHNVYYDRVTKELKIADGEVDNERYGRRYLQDMPLKTQFIQWTTEQIDETKVLINGSYKKEYTRFEYLYTYLYEQQMAIAAKYFVHYNLKYLEIGKQKKAYPKREKILQAAVWWSNQMMLRKFDLDMPDAPTEFRIKPSVIIFSTFPSSGKSYLNNTLNEMFTLLSREITGRGGVLRVSNEQGNIERQSKMTMDLISNPLILNVYRDLRKYVKDTGKFDPFVKRTLEEWGMHDCRYAPNTSIFKTRDSAINSIRCEFGIYDDPSRGMQECDNVDIHQAITLKYNTDFMDRFDDPEDIMIMLTGTMFNPFDVFSTEIQRVFEAGGVTKDTRFPSEVYISGDKKTVIILNDVQTEDGKSAFPDYISDDAVAKKRDSIPSYEYHCIWRQKPIPAEGLVFSKEYLAFYDKLPDNLSDYSFAAIDPTRKKAGDFFAMPVFKICFDDNKYYLVDIIFERKATIDLYPRIVEKILSDRIIKLIYEENIDKSMGVVIKNKLKEENYPYCDLIPEYSKANKQQRIIHMADTIKQWIVFPSSKFIKSTTPLGLAVNQLMEYDGEKSKHDDFPDALAMFANLQIVNSDRKNKVTTAKYLPW